MTYFEVFFDIAGLDSALSSRAMSAGLNDVEINFASITILKDIGAGATGKVILGRWKGAYVAVKKFYDTAVPLPCWHLTYSGRRH